MKNDSNPIFVRGRLASDDLVRCRPSIVQLLTDHTLVVVGASPDDMEATEKLFAGEPNIVVRLFLDEEDQSFFLDKVWRHQKLALLSQ